MTFSGSLHKSQALFLFILAVTFVAFTGDILDVRDEIHLLSCPYDSLDNNITTGIQNSFSPEQEPILTYFNPPKVSSVPISVLTTLTFYFRAPPA
jgi:hypothetical protein